MKKSGLIILLFLGAVIFTGCIDDIKEKFKDLQGEVTKVIHPVPKCSNPEVVVEVNTQLTGNALYGTHAVMKTGTILFVNADANTDTRTCKAVVSYTIDEKDNKISSFLSKVPGIKSVSKDRTIEYTVARDKTQESFVVNIK